MSSKTIVITGGTSGIGEAAAVRLASEGARIVLVARDRARAETTLAKLKAANASASHAAHYADLSSLAEMRRVGAEIAAAEPRIDVLINNAGAVFLSRKLSPDGLEMTFATNHMAYFIVTSALLPNLKATPGARIVSTASGAHRSAQLDLDDLQFQNRSFSAFTVYGTSKLCNILFTRELARRLAGSSVIANCLHPGVVRTRFGANNRLGPIFGLLRSALMSAGISPEEGAKTIVYLASSQDVAAVSGKYFVKCKAETPTAAAQDDIAAGRLWEISEQLTAAG